MKRTAEWETADSSEWPPSVVRFTDFVAYSSLPSDESLGYCQSSAAADWFVGYAKHQFNLTQYPGIVALAERNSGGYSPVPAST